MLEPRNNSPMFAIAYLSLTHLCLYILHTYIVYLFICLIYLYLIEYILGFVCSHLYSTKRAKVAPQLLIYRNLEEIVQSPSPGIRLHSLVVLGVFSIIVLVCIISFNSTFVLYQISLSPIPPLQVTYRNHGREPLFDRF